MMGNEGEPIIVIEDRGLYRLHRAQGSREVTAVDAKPAEDLIAGLGKRMYRLLQATGAPTLCQSCKAECFWIYHRKSKKRVLYNGEGLNHFADCPDAAAWRKSSRKERATDARGN